jgi:hypothetical protein
MDAEFYGQHRSFQPDRRQITVVEGELTLLPRGFFLVVAILLCLLSQQEVGRQ